ncbi:MAG: hypothetical protein KDH20_18155 [Rhodocyclaceae bacterium]|nr:hypothetical protein [Rhodocyclaceae bacterium]
MPEPPSPAPPDVRLVSLRLGETARHIRDRLASQSQRPGVASRAWPWIRASLGGELDVAFVHTFNALQALHQAVFSSSGVVSVGEIRERLGAMRHCIDHTLHLHREVAAALAPANPLREPVLRIIAGPLEQIAGLFDAMQHALGAPIDGPPGHEAQIEVELAVALDFSAQLADAEKSASASGSPPAA